MKPNYKTTTGMVTKAPYDWEKDPEKRVAINEPAKKIMKTMTPHPKLKKRGLQMVINYINKLKAKERGLLVQLDDIRAEYKEIERLLNSSELL